MKTRAELIEEALVDILNAASGNKKRCGHEFECVCPWDAAKAALAMPQEQHFKPNPEMVGKK